MRFYEFKRHPAAETLGHGLIWWRPRSTYVEVPADALANHAIELELTEWLKRFREKWGVYEETVMEACEDFAMSDLGKRLAEKRFELGILPGFPLPPATPV